MASELKASAPQLFTQIAEVQTDKADKLIQRLCYHFSRKVEAEWEQDFGLVTFAEGICKMENIQVEGRPALRFTCQSPSAEFLQAIVETIDRHMDGFSKSELSLAWADVAI